MIQNFLITLAVGVVFGAIALFVAQSEAREEPQSYDSRRRRARSPNPDTNTDSTNIPVQPSSNCSICFENFSHAPLEQLPCFHLFHAKCLIRWLETNRRCPICRSELSEKQFQVYKKRNTPYLI